MTLRNRFTAFFVTFAVGISALGGWLSWNAISQALEDQLDRELLSVGGVVRDVALRVDEGLLLLEAGQEDTQEWRDYQELLQLLINTANVDLADIFRWTPGDMEAEALVTAQPPDSISIGQPLSWVVPYLAADVPQAYSDGEATTTRFTGLDGRDYKYVFVRLLSGEAFLGMRIPADHLAPLGRLAWTIAGLSVAAAALAALVGWRLAGGIVSRLEMLSRGALRIQRGFMDRPFSLEGEDEVGRLARAMERMRTGIQRRDEQLRLMLSRVAHEIRNPLGGLELFAAAALDTEDPQERRRILERVRTEVMGLNGIINEFLEFARPGSAERELHDVRASVSEAAALAEAELKKKGGDLHRDFPDTPLLALADPRQVKRLVLNLLRNAAHAGETVWVEGLMVNGEVRITVRDDGPGIDKELRDRIFEPFVGDKEQGAGLGLAIVKELVDANNGRVELASEGPDAGNPGVGAEFRVYLGGPEDLPADGARPEAKGEGMAR